MTTMSELGPMIQRVFAAAGLSERKEFAERLGVTPTTISRVLNEVAPVGDDLLKKISKVFATEMKHLGLSLNDLIRAKLLDGERDPEVRRAIQEITRKDRDLATAAGPSHIRTSPRGPLSIPIIGEAHANSAGNWTFEEVQPATDFVKVTDQFAVRISGNSMAPIAYDGQAIVCSRNDSVRDGDLCWCRLKDGRAFFKRYRTEGTRAILESVNVVSREATITVSQKQIEDIFKVVGVWF